MSPAHVVRRDRRSDQQPLPQIRNATVNEDMRTPLHEAAIDGDLGLALTRVHSEEDIDQTDQDGNTPLFLAVTNKNVDIVEALLEAGANPRWGIATAILNGTDAPRP